MKLSNTFFIVIIFLVIAGLSVFGYFYLKEPQETEVVQAPTKTSSTDADLTQAETDLKEVDSIELDLSSSELESLENDLDPTQFDVL